MDGRTDENAQQILSMLGEVLQEAKITVTDLANRTPSPPQRSTDALSDLPSSSSSPPPPPPQGSHIKTFHSAASKPPFHETADDNCKISSSSSSSVKGNSSEETTVQEHKGAILTATKDLLQPLVSQLSQDLSEGILKLIRERVDETF